MNETELIEKGKLLDAIDRAYKAGHLQSLEYKEALAGVQAGVRVALELPAKKPEEPKEEEE